MIKKTILAAGASLFLLSGIFAATNTGNQVSGIEVSPTKSPTASPTASPTVAPSPTDSPSPVPSPTDMPMPAPSPTP